MSYHYIHRAVRIPRLFAGRPNVVRLIFTPQRGNQASVSNHTTGTTRLQPHGAYRQEVRPHPLPYFQAQHGNQCMSSITATNTGIQTSKANRFIHDDHHPSPYPSGNHWSSFHPQRGSQQQSSSTTNSTTNSRRDSRRDPHGNSPHH
ncbi:unnamed protein product [Cunninghamella blakesleeana]